MPKFFSWAACAIQWITQTGCSHQEDQMDKLRQVGDSTRSRLAAVGNVHRAGAEKFMADLALVDARIQTAYSDFSITPAMHASLHHLTQEYMEAVLAISADTCAELSDDLSSHTQCDRLEQISEVYLQCVHEILFSKEYIDVEKTSNAIGADASDAIR